MRLLTDTNDLSLAIKDFESALPGWWWSIGHCSLTRDASCGPDRTGPDAKLLSLKKFDDGFHCDDPEGTLASSLRNVTSQAQAAKAEQAQEMTEIDAAELARLRENVEVCKVNVVISKSQLLALIDALEKAWGELRAHIAKEISSTPQ